MKKFSVLIVAAVCVSVTTDVASGQRYTVYGKAGSSGTYTRIGGALNEKSGVPAYPGYPLLPQKWVDAYELDGATTYTVIFPSSGTGGSWVCGASNYGPYTAGSQSSLQQAINDVEACGHSGSVTLEIPPALFSGSTGIVVPQTSAIPNTFAKIVRSTADASLPDHETVCTHGIQDNLPTSTDIGIANPDCTGNNMYYQLGSTVTTIPQGAFNLANGTNAKTSAYNDVQYMWKVESTNSGSIPLSFCNASGTGQSPACSTNIAPDHWLIEDGEVRRVAGDFSDGNLVSSSKQAETSSSQLPSHIHFRKMWVHGDWAETVAGLAIGRNSVARAFFFDANYGSITDSYVSEVMRPGLEGHAVAYGYGTTQKIVHNWFSGESIGSLTGGFAVSGISGWVPAQNMEFRRNRFTFPYVWLGQNLSSNAHWAGSSVGRKNAFESKVGQYWIVAGNIFENVDNSGGQGGPISDYKTTSISGGGNLSTQANPQHIFADAYTADNVWRNSCNGLQIEGRGGANDDSIGVSFGMRRVAYLNNLFYNITTSNPGCTGVNKTGHSVDTNHANWRGTIQEDATGTVATFRATCASDIGGNCPAGPPPLALQNTDVLPGDPIWIFGCTDASFNTPTTTIAGHTIATVGALATDSTSPTGLVVNFAHVGTPNSREDSGNCQLNVRQSWPKYLTYVHNTLITDATWAINSNTGFSGQGGGTTNVSGQYAQYNLFRNNITLGSGCFFNNPAGEGTNTEKLVFDISTFTADHLVCPTRGAASYTEYGNNPNYPDSAGCTGAGCSPPQTIYFPSTAHCTGASPDATCVGFLGGMNASSMPVTLNDYHQYALHSSSSFKAGASRAASDGKDMGVDLSSIDSAQTTTTYICPYDCGKPGPYPD